MAFTHLEPTAVVRSEIDGFWTHPILKSYIKNELNNTERLSDQEWDQMSKDLNVQFRIVDIESDASESVLERFMDKGDVLALKDWIPSLPDNDPTWFLVSIYEHEDGASALWAKKIPFKNEKGESQPTILLTWPDPTDHSATTL